MLNIIKDGYQSSLSVEQNENKSSIEYVINVITINLRELHFHSKEQAENKSCIVVTIFNAACTLGAEDGGE